jgi:hypothetical protein
MSIFLTADQIAEITNYINDYRAKNQAPPLTWDMNIQPDSQSWSDYLLKNDLFQHSGNTNYGENLAYFQGYGTDLMTLLKLSVDSWYNEISSYNFLNPGFSGATGHFTALVWVSSTKFAMGISIDTTTGSADIVFNTSPPGNVEGQFQTNVLPILEPIPVPNPPIPPIPISNKAIILKIINDLYNVLYSINKKQPKYFVIQYIQSIINEINNASISNTIINKLNIIINTIQRVGYNRFVINSLNSTIQQLKGTL